jgi:hypothetical protein
MEKARGKEVDKVRRDAVWAWTLGPRNSSMLEEVIVGG